MFCVLRFLCSAVHTNTHIQNTHTYTHALTHTYNHTARKTGSWVIELGRRDFLNGYGTEMKRRMNKELESKVIQEALIMEGFMGRTNQCSGS